MNVTFSIALALFPSVIVMFISMFIMTAVFTLFGFMGTKRACRIQPCVIHAGAMALTFLVILWATVPLDYDINVVGSLMNLCLRLIENFDTLILINYLIYICTVPRGNDKSEYATLWKPEYRANSSIFTKPYFIIYHSIELTIYAAQLCVCNFVNKKQKNKT
jgi:hypothetical protein